MSAPAAIETLHLAKTYKVGFFGTRTVLALKDLSLQVPSNQIYGLLGPNGAGKSTTIKLVLNLIRPTAGSAKVFGLDAADTAARRNVGFLPENPAPYEYLTGKELVTLGGRLSGLSGAELTTQVKSCIERVGMSDAAGLQIRRYSKGMVQRISLAHALVGKPKLLILDEPTSGLDVLGRQLIRDILLEERQRGTSILFCSHIIPDVEALCDRVAILIGGNLVREGSVSELLSTQRSQMEAIIEGLDATAIDGFGVTFSAREAMGARWVLRFEDKDTPRVLEKALASQGKVLELRASKFSLEQMFLEALKAAGRTVGSDLS
jgi:ABC-2 type transport system ATP-binding protein